MSKNILSDIWMLLDEEAERINSPAFIANDPVQFPRQFSKLQDIEIASLLVSSIAWGNRKMICNNSRKMLDIMENSPYDFVMDKAYEGIPDINIHRTFFAKDMRHFLRGLNRIYSHHSSLNDFAKVCGAAQSELPAWTLVERINHELAEANGGVGDSRCLPLNLKTTALKRVNMALRWLVRDDGIVDMGVWNALKPSQLYIPLDVHVGNTARDLELISRKSNDKTTVIELTDVLRQRKPDDPVWYDYALFGIGVHNPLNDNSEESNEQSL